MRKAKMLLIVRCLAGSIFSATLILGGCASHSSGVAAYKRGEYSKALKECRANRTPEGDFALGLMYYKGEGVKRDPKEAATYFRRSAEQGHAGAQYNIGLMRLNGRWVQKDLKKSAYWFHLSAEQENARAQYNLGLMYARGDGVEKDRRKAVGWLARSAHQGNGQALAKLKVLLADGSWKKDAVK
ncbi:MAG: tetratricopeptide repeat protein [Geobacteraceae bacterium]|nr:tetratricopeptide repeat protein [Geobacteraceae bacterium]